MPRILPRLLRRTLPRTLSARLALVAGLLACVSSVACLAVVQRTATRELVDDVDADLATQAREWEALVATMPVHDRDDLIAVARAYLVQQHEHPLSQLQVVRVAGGGPELSNQPTLARRSADVLATAPEGYAVASIDGGRAEVYTRTVRDGDRVLGTLQVADSLSQVDAARATLRAEALAVGTPLSLGAAALVALAAVGMMRPLRRICDVAGRVGEGEWDARPHAGPAATREIAEVTASLQRMLDRVQSSFEAERRFVADASHELRTPLSVLRAHAESVRRRTDDPDVAGELGSVLRRIDGVARLVDDLLTLAVADATGTGAGSRTGTALLAPASIDIGDLAADLARDLPLLGDRRFVVRADPGVLHADPVRIDQVLRNLTGNAVRHTVAGGTVEVRFATASDGRLEMVVEDDGEGVHPDLLPSVFERFRSGPPGTPRGAGLGLAICRALVEAHGGSIAMYSRWGYGTRVQVLLPGWSPAPVQTGLASAAPDTDAACGTERGISYQGGVICRTIPPAVPPAVSPSASARPSPS